MAEFAVSLWTFENLLTWWITIYSFFYRLFKYNLPNFLLLWLASCQQRVWANSSVSTFRKLNGAMPQGSFLGPLAFLILTDNLSNGCLLHKYVDDTTLSELVRPKQHDTWPSYLADLHTWTAQNGMSINTSNTKDMVRSRLAITNSSFLNISSQTIERVNSYELLGIHIDSSLSWSIHIDYIIKEATTRLHFLKQLKLKLIDHLRATHWTPSDYWQTDNSNGLVMVIRNYHRLTPYHWFKWVSVNNFHCLTLTFDLWPLPTIPG